MQLYRLQHAARVCHSFLHLQQCIQIHTLPRQLDLCFMRRSGDAVKSKFLFPLFSSEVSYAVHRRRAYEPYTATVLLLLHRPHAAPRI